MNSKVAVFITISVLAIAGMVPVIASSLDDGTDADITIACGTKNCYEPFWIAEEYGLFDMEGVKVKMNYVDGGGNATTALLNGSVDLTLVGADPAIRLFESSEGGYAVATVETSKSSSSSNDFAYRTDCGIDLEDASTFFNPDGSVKVHCGIDTATAYFSGYISYLYDQYEYGKITEEQYKILKTTRTIDKDGGIVHIPFDSQAAALVTGEVQMICSGNTVEIASDKDNIATGSASFASVVGGIVIIVSDEAYNEKSDAIIKVLKALDKACMLIEDPKTVDDVSQFCADYYNSSGWTAEKQKNFFGSYYWDICNMTSMSDYLEYKAKLLDIKNPDYDQFIKTDLVVKAHECVTLYDGLYTYDHEKGILVEA